MSLGGLFQIREPVLRGLLFGMGGFFVAVAAGILLTRQWQAGESRLVLLVPLLSGLALVSLPLLLRGLVLRVAVIALFAIPAVVVFLWRGACAFGLLAGASCG